MKLTPRYDGPPVIASTGAASDQLAPTTRQRRRLATTLGELDAEDWNAPSRCAGWTVHDVVAHLVGVNDFWNASVRAGVAGTPTRVLTGFDPAATPPLMVEPMRTLTPAELLERFVASNDGFLATIAELDDAAWSMTAEAPPGHISIGLLAQHALWDSWVHERDIALPLGAVPVAEPDELESCLQYAAALSPAFAIIAGTGPRGTFSVVATNPGVSFVLDVGQSVVVHVGASGPEAPSLRGDASELVEALSLRAPLPLSAHPEWRDLLGGLATTFDADIAAAG